MEKRPVLGQPDLGQPPGSEASVLRCILPGICGECVPVFGRCKPKRVSEPRRAVRIWRSEIVRELWAAQDAKRCGREREILHNIESTNDRLYTPAELLNLLFSRAASLLQVICVRFSTPQAILL